MDLSKAVPTKNIHCNLHGDIGFIAGLLTSKRVTDMPIPKETAVCVL